MTSAPGPYEGHHGHGRRFALTLKICVFSTPGRGASTSSSMSVRMRRDLSQQSMGMARITEAGICRRQHGKHRPTP